MRNEIRILYRTRRESLENDRGKEQDRNAGLSSPFIPPFRPGLSDGVPCLCITRFRRIRETDLP